MGSQQIGDKQMLNIIDLNSDCLSEILKFLKFVDLFNLYKVHPCFESPIKDVVSKTWVVLKMDRYNKELVKDFNKFLNSFGNQITRLYVDSSSIKTMEKLISQYCSAGNVVKCVFSSFEIRTEFVMKNPSFFQSIKELDLCYKKRPESITAALNGATGLENLYVSNHSIKFTDIFTNLKTSQLEVMEIYGNKLVIGNLSQLPSMDTMKFLKLVFRNDYDGNFAFQILDLFPNIDCLSLMMYDTTEFLLSIPKLNKLKRLQISLLRVYDDDVETLFASLAENNNLEELSIRTGDYWFSNFCIQSICKMTNVQIFCLETNVPLQSCLLDTARSLSNLNEFSYISTIPDTSDNSNIYMLLGFLGFADNLAVVNIDDLETEVFGYEKLCNEMSTICRNKKRNGSLIVNILNDSVDCRAVHTDCIKMNITNSVDNFYFYK